MSDKRDKLLGIHEGLDINTYMEMELIFSVFHSTPNRWPLARSAGSGGGRRYDFLPGRSRERSARGERQAQGWWQSILFFLVDRYV